MIKKYINPASTADLVVENNLGEVLLIKRKYSPFKDCWALPGGFLDCGKETLEHTGKRELEEEVSLKTEERFLKFIGVYSNPRRDPRGHVISHAYYVEKYSGIAKAADDAKELRWFSKDSLPDLAFDHKIILRDYFEKKKMGVFE